MNFERLPDRIPATPEYILEVLRDLYRQQCQFDPEVERDVELTFATTVEEWRSACDLVGWRRLGREFDEFWSLGRSDAEWKAVLEPARRRTLRDVCEFIASGATRPSIAPLTILGKPCLPAGVFVAVRSLLAAAGADVRSLAPSTPLEGFTRPYFRVFVGEISKLAPNSLPLIRVTRPGRPWSLYDLSIAGLLLAPLIIVGGPLLFETWGPIPGVVLMLVSWGGTWVFANALPPSKVEFGDLRTFRDLSRLFAERSLQSPN